MPAVYSKYFDFDFTPSHKKAEQKAIRLLAENVDFLREIHTWPTYIRQRKLRGAGFTDDQIDTLHELVIDEWGCTCNRCLKVQGKDTAEVKKAIERAQLPAKVENFFARAPANVKVAIYEGLGEKDKEGFLKWNLAYILEMGRRRGVSLNLGAILRCEALAWFNYPPIKQNKMSRKPRSKREIVERVKQEAKLEPESVPQPSMKAAWDRRTLLIMKAMTECGAVFYPKN